MTRPRPKLTHRDAALCGAWRILLALVVSGAASGCSLTQSMAHNCWHLPRRQWDEWREDRNLHACARAAWTEHTAVRARRRPFADTYQQGFIDGYVDYAKNGGSGEPPPIPPKRFWTAHYQNATGKNLIEQWFDGYRAGASDARETGRRQCVTVPTALIGAACPSPVAAVPASQLASVSYPPPQPPQPLHAAPPPTPPPFAPPMPQRTPPTSPPMPTSPPPPRPLPMPPAPPSAPPMPPPQPIASPIPTQPRVPFEELRVPTVDVAPARPGPGAEEQEATTDKPSLRLPTRWGAGALPPRGAIRILPPTEVPTP